MERVHFDENGNRHYYSDTEDEKNLVDYCPGKFEKQYKCMSNFLWTVVISMITSILTVLLCTGLLKL